MPRWKPAQSIYFTPTNNLSVHFRNNRDPRCDALPRNYRITNPPATKTHFAQALPAEACRTDYSARFFRTDTLINHLAVLKHPDLAHITFFESLQHTIVLVLGVFLTPFDDSGWR